MSPLPNSYRTVFVGDLVQTTALSTGGRDGALYADAIMARDGAGRPILRGSGLAGALLAALDDFAIEIPKEISNRLPAGKGEEPPKHESLWLLHHAHLVRPEADPQVRPNVAIHPWTGAAADGLYFSTESLPRGTRWRLIIETDDWRDPNVSNDNAAARLLALALREWQQGRCWLGRSPARGLGWNVLENLRVFRLASAAAAAWPDAGQNDNDNIARLQRGDVDGAREIPLQELLTTSPRRRSRWHRYTGTISIGEHDDGYGLDTLSTLGRDFPLDDDEWAHWRSETAQGDVEGRAVSADIELDYVPAWTYAKDADGKRTIEFMVPGSGIRGALRSALSAHLRGSGKTVWSPNHFEPNPEPEPGDTADDSPHADPLLPMFGGMKNDSNLLISDAWPIGTPPQLYVQEQHAEDEFTQGPYGSSKFNRPCLVAGTFTFSLVLRERLHGGLAGLAGTALREAQNALALANALGQARMLPLGGGVWRGHGWVKLTLQEQAPADEQGERVTQPPEQANQETNA